MNEGYEDPATPDLDELQQMEAGGLRVPVRLDQHVPVYILPSRRAVCFNVSTSSTGEPVPLLSADLRRRRAVIVADAAALIGDRDMVRDGHAFILPSGVPLVVEHTESIWTRAYSADGNEAAAIVSALAENWAD